LDLSLADMEGVKSNRATAMQIELFMLHLGEYLRCPNAGLAYFFSAAVKFVTTVTAWLTCC